MKAFREALAKGPQLGLANHYPACGIIERIGGDWDWIWVDGQHGQLSYQDIIAAVRAAGLVSRPSVVRVPGQDYGSIGRALDTGADGVMVPMVDTPEQARQAVQAAKFPPVGSRSFGGRRAADLYGHAYANPDTPQPLLICQIETPAGLANVNEIAATEGVDALFFGAEDFALRQGRPMDVPRPDDCYDNVLQTIARAARQHGKVAGAIFRKPEQVAKAVEMGYTLITVALDVLLLAEASLAQAKTVRACLK